MICFYGVQMRILSPAPKNNPRHFPLVAASVFARNHLITLVLRTPYQVQSAQTYNPETGRRRDRETGRQGDRETGRQADRQTGRQADRQTGRQADRQTPDDRVPAETEQVRTCCDSSAQLTAVLPRSPHKSPRVLCSQHRRHGRRPVLLSMKDGGARVDLVYATPCLTGEMDRRVTEYSAKYNPLGPLQEPNTNASHEDKTCMARNTDGIGL